MKKCPICLKHFSHLEQHHIIPVCYGGPKDGPLLNVCSTCHQHIHYQAENLVAKTVKRKHYFSVSDLERAKPYITMVIMAKQHHTENKIPTNKKMNFELDGLHHQLLKIKCKDAGYTNLQKYIVDVLKAHAKSVL